MTRLPFLIELFTNGVFIILYLLGSRVSFEWAAVYQKSLVFFSYLVPIVFFFLLTFFYSIYQNFNQFFRNHIFTIAVFLPSVIVWGQEEYLFYLAIFHLGSMFVINTIIKRQKFHVYGLPVIRELQLKPAQIVILSFAFLIFIGAFLLSLPISTKTGEGLKLIDAFFLATSATCVTGLSTISVAHDMSFIGQVIVLILMQIGGLGIMTLSSSMTILLGRSFAIRDAIVMQNVLDIASSEELVDLIIDIVRFTFLIELIGAAILTGVFISQDYSYTSALYYGVFHSISAFCNAGFSLFDNSLEFFYNQPLIHGTIATLVVLGGLGFVVLKELSGLIKKPVKFVRLSLHSKVVITLTAVLLFLGFCMFFFGEYLSSFDNYTLWEKIQISLFQSVTMRTAGFNTIPLAQLNMYTLFLMTLFMFVGASPGSTGGGIKTTTLAILFQSIRSSLRGKGDVIIYDKRISQRNIIRTTAITIISLIVINFFILILLNVEKDKSFISIIFEVASAFGTVGLSIGITPFLSLYGKFSLMILMFIGRVGPLTLAFALGKNRLRENYQLPEARIMIG